MILQVSIPNPEYVAKDLLATPLRALGLRAYRKPLDFSPDDFGEKHLLEEWTGRPALTSLVLQFGGDKIELIECIMTVVQERNIVSTALQGRNGTIKEYISDGDYQIEVAAAILPAKRSMTNNEDTDTDSFIPLNDNYPLEELMQFMKLLKAQDNISVQSDFLDLFGISSAVVKSYGFEQQTHGNRQAFSLTMLSDSPYEIKIKEDVKA